MVTSLVYIWSADSETDICQRESGSGGGGKVREMGEREEGGGRLHGDDVKSRFSCIEENISPFLSFSHKHTHTHSVRLSTPSYGNSTASL